MSPKDTSSPAHAAEGEAANNGRKETVLEEAEEEDAREGKSSKRSKTPSRRSKTPVKSSRKRRRDPTPEKAKESEAKNSHKRFKK